MGAMTAQQYFWASLLSGLAHVGLMAALAGTALLARRLWQQWDRRRRTFPVEPSSTVVGPLPERARTSDEVLGDVFAQLLPQVNTIGAQLGTASNTSELRNLLEAAELAKKLGIDEVSSWARGRAVLLTEAIDRATARMMADSAEPSSALGSLYCTGCHCEQPIAEEGKPGGITQDEAERLGWAEFPLGKWSQSEEPDQHIWLCPRCAPGKVQVQ